MIKVRARPDSHARAKSERRVSTSWHDPKRLKCLLDKRPPCAACIAKLSLFPSRIFSSSPILTLLPVSHYGGSPDDPLRISLE